eukprot:6204201-Pleurochrysis_carterae.AAC.5
MLELMQRCCPWPRCAAAAALAANLTAACAAGCKSASERGHWRVEYRVPPARMGVGSNAGGVELRCFLGRGAFGATAIAIDSEAGQNG